ncbi:MAG: quinolinate synthase NadA [Bacteroidales bacterium]|nr:quinolinate synthase NadA [Bacteroidales bacterium]
MNNIYNMTVENGYVQAEIDPNLNLVAEINKLKKEKNAVIMAHYYQTGDIQDIADVIGDSLALAQKAVNIDADIILLAGVHFMGETVKVLNMDKKVLVPDLNAGCSLADSCKAADLKKFIDEHPDHTVVSYVNTTAEVKALTDVVVTSSNALKVVNSFPADQKIIFGPDRNLGSYINAQTGRNMLLWNGACHVHERFSLEQILALKKANPGAEIICHPECKRPIVLASDFVGSTAALLSHINNSSADTFIVATEEGILHQMKLSFPDKNFIPAPPETETGMCGCNNCEYMKLNTLQKLYLTLKYELPEITLDPDLAAKARKPIDAMLELSK